MAVPRSSARELTSNAIQVLEARYLQRDAAGQLIETPDGLFRRVARAVAAAEAGHGPAGAASQWEEKFFEAMSSLEFLPNSPTLMNAGTALGQLSACFVLPVGDSIEEIFDSLGLMARIQRSGGGTGFSFSRLRPRGDFVAGTGGRSSGPVSFMRVFDAATENIRQGGKRRGANMGVLRVDHPDIEEFIAAKLDGKSFANFNLSVAVTDEFMQAAAAGAVFALRHPRNHEQVRTVDASALLARIAAAAWQSGEPGLLFLDAIERAHPVGAGGPIEATNPCGEVPLLPYEACNLGSLNLPAMLRRDGEGRGIDWEKLAAAVHLAVRFLDDVIEVCRWPSPQIREATLANRKIGLGVMGFAELLIGMGISYGSPEAAGVAEEVMAHIAGHARLASRELARERGVFPAWERSSHARSGLHLRNATLTSIAPTGTISIIAGTSAGIEPLFALVYRHCHVLGHEQLLELNPLFREHALRGGFYSDSLAMQLAASGNLAGVAGVPEDCKRLFRTALELSASEHLAIQAAFQRHVDNAVSKTINLPHEAEAHEVESAWREAWALGLKGITCYRYGSRSQQVCVLGAGETPEEHEHYVACERAACKL